MNSSDGGILKLNTDVQIEELGLYVHRGYVREMESFHAHFEIELNYVYEGHMRYFMGQSEFTVESGQLVAFWGSTPHRLIDTGLRTTAAILTVPMAWFTQWSLPTSITQGLFEGGVLMESTFRTERSRVDLWAEQLNSNARAERLATQLELHAAFLRMTPKSLTPNWETTLPTDVTPVVGMCRYIAMNLRTALSSVEIAASVNLHPNYAARVFKRLTGMGIQDYVMHQRVASTQRLLITTQSSIEQIGELAGFQSQSQFFASFKKATGQTPLQYRKQNLRQVSAK